MKKFIYMLIATFILMPTIVFAEAQARDLKETVEEAGLTFKAENYKESADQVTIYLFHRSSCSHCHDAITWLNDIAEEHGYKFKLRSFEITYNQNNNEIYHQIIEYLDVKEGVPLILIGKDQFRGFGDSTGEKLLKKIDASYENPDDYDIFDAIEKYASKSEEPKTEDESKPTPIETQSSNHSKTNAWTIVMIVAGVGILVAIVALVITLKKKR